MEKMVNFAPGQPASPQHVPLKQCLANENITVLEHTTYSPDLAPCEFYLFPNIKSVFRGIHFVSVESVKEKRRRSSTALQNMTCGIALNIGSIVCSCVSTRKGTIFKVIVVDFLNLLNNNNNNNNNNNKEKRRRERTGTN